jgi:hypothetical protein
MLATPRFGSAFRESKNVSSATGPSRISPGRKQRDVVTYRAASRGWSTAKARMSASPPAKDREWAVRTCSDLPEATSCSSASLDEIAALTGPKLAANVLFAAREKQPRSLSRGGSGYVDRFSSRTPD